MAIQKSLIINAVGNAGTNVGKKYQKSVTNVNPAVSNAVAGTFATMANALTTNVYGNAQIVKKMPVSEEDTAAVTLEVDSTNYTGSAAASSATIEGGVRITLDGEGYIDVTY